MVGHDLLWDWEHCCPMPAISSANRPFATFKRAMAGPWRGGAAKCVLVYPITGILSHHTQSQPSRGYHRVTKAAKNADIAKTTKKLHKLH